MEKQTPESMRCRPQRQQQTERKSAAHLKPCAKQLFIMLQASQDIADEDCSQGAAIVGFSATRLQVFNTFFPSSI